MFILEVINQCSSPALAAIISAFKKMMTLIQIIVPILLMIASAKNVFSLVKNPDDKKLPAKIRNSVIAAALVFFIPMLVNVVMGMVDNSYDISACWNETVYENFKVVEYIDPNGDTSKKTFIPDSKDYEKGKPKPVVPSTNNNNNSNNNSSNSSNSSNPSNNLPSTPGNIEGDLQVHYINPKSRVDAIYIKVGDKSIYIDGGFGSDAKKEIAYMDKIGVTHIDYYIASHSHTNHVEAAPPIIQKYGIKTVVVGRETCNGRTPCSEQAIRGFASKKGVNLSGVSFNVLKPGDQFYVGALKITCLGPITVYNGMAPTVTKQNYNSLVLRMDYGSTSFLFPGDNSSSGTYNEIEKRYPGALNVDVYKNAHHNSCPSGSTLQKVNAEYVIFTTRHDYLPSASCVNGLKKYGVKYYFIAADKQSGNILVTSDGTKLNAYPHYKD